MRKLLIALAAIFAIGTVIPVTSSTAEAKQGWKHHITTGGSIIIAAVTWDGRAGVIAVGPTAIIVTGDNAS